VSRLPRVAQDQENSQPFGYHCEAMTMLSLCMIVRDESAMLPACLESVRGVVDELVVVDTGSTDDTRELARALGAKVLEHPWCEDFAAPRNTGLAACTSDWVLVLDADERLTRSGGAALLLALESAAFDCGLLPLHNAARVDSAFDAVVNGSERIAEVAYLPRLLRRTSDLRYTGIIHENVGEWASKGRRHAILRGVDIVHLGGVPDVRAKRDKYRRNVRLLEAACARNPDDPSLWGYLAYEHQEAGERGAARRAADAGWKVVLAGTSIFALTMLRLATARAWLQVQSDELVGATETLDQAGDLIAAQPDIHFIRGCISELEALRADTLGVRAARLADARRHVAAARACRDAVHLQRFIHGSTGWAAETRLGVVELLEGDAAAALSSFDAALAENTEALEARCGRVEALLLSGDARAALREVQPALGDRPDGWVLAACAAGLAGGVEAMATWVGRAQATLAAGFLSPHRRERYHDALGVLALMLGHEVEVPGPLGELAALAMGRGEDAGRPVARGLGDPLVTALARRAVTQLLRSGRVDEAERLVSPSAERRLPGLGRLVEEAIGALEREGARGGAQ